MIMPTRRRKLADGSGDNNSSGQSCVVRAIDAGAALRRSATSVLHALDDDITEVHGPALTELSLEDSAVMVVDEALSAIRKTPR